MERLIGFIFFIWLAAMVLGVIIALLPVLAYIAGFVGTILIVTFIGRLVGSWFFW